MKPLAGSWSDVKANSLGVVVDEWVDDWPSEFTRLRPKEGPESSEPFVLETRGGEERCKVERQQQADYGRNDIVTGIGQ